MKNDNIVAGVGIGGMTDKYEIKILICYLLKSVPTPLSKEEINFVFQNDSLVNYFSFCEAFQELAEQKHILPYNEKEKTVYKLSNLGVDISEKLSRSLPTSLRDKVVTAAVELITRLKIERENKVEIIPCENGYTLNCAIQDEKFEILKFQIYMPDMIQAELAQNSFLKDPATFYQKFLSILFNQE